jgi:histidyl-tRNA synthetase
MANEKTLKARSPRGFADRSAADIRATEEMVAKIRAVYERYGFEPVETPLVEFTESLGKFLPDQDRPNEGVFSFRDEDAQEARSEATGKDKEGEWLSLRYDLTAPLARYVAENYERLPKPYRSYRVGWVFRNEKPGPGRFRQFMQFDADTVGAQSPAADAEMCMMMADTLETLGIERGQYVIKVNSRKMLDGVMEDARITDERQKLAVLRAIDKRDRLGVEGVTALLGKGRKDESGDFTPGADLRNEQIDRILSLVQGQPATPGERFVSIRGSGSFGLSSAPGRGDDTDDEMVGAFDYIDNDKTLDSWERLFENSPTAAKAVHELRAIVAAAAAAGYRSKRVRIDSSIVRGLEYYTGAVFEAELTLETYQQGQPVVFGSVGGGGRYDGLVGRFMKENVPATGFSIGVSRLQAALSALGKLDTKEGSGPVVVLVMDKARTGDYQKMVADLRAANIPAEMYLGDSGMRAQMKYADKRDAPLVVIQGGDEKAKGIVQIKDMREGKKLAEGVADHDTYREARLGQGEVPEGELVAAVARMLGRAP